MVSKLFNHAYAYIFQLPDGRIVFAIPYEGEFTLIGTTDRDNPGSPFEVSASEDEIAYLCDAASEYFSRPVRPADVVHSYAGVRALIDDGSASIRKAGATTSTVPCCGVNPVAVTVTVTLPRASLTPWT